eukprot:CAMPEP_0181372332 /NCGR_PEP_ID=MMETSP1106-20121128/14661_1 /TAXON_ID=81844 /ORGANISM="Mantoniella antarctica, Strain SL-175" /LENGTH=385 /DNA_ID=CAMNT_0023489701 /DNA_START=146 /DNA_END=1300 /DNA_ORIENTATION=-
MEEVKVGGWGVPPPAAAAAMAAATHDAARCSPKTPGDLRDMLCRRYRADPPAGFRPEALAPATLGGLPLSFILTLMPEGFAISKPPPSADPRAPPPPLWQIAAALGPMLHPYDRSSRSLLQAVDSGRLPRALLDGLPLKYVDGAVLAEVRDYRGCSMERGRAVPHAYVAVMHPTSGTVAADAEELCAQLDVVAPVTGEGYWANLGCPIRMSPQNGAEAPAQAAGAREVDEGTGIGCGGDGENAMGVGRKGDTDAAATVAAAAKGAGCRGAGEEKTGEDGEGKEECEQRRRRKKDTAAQAQAAAQLSRRLAVEGALLAATSAPLCLDPSPAVAAARRAARATASAAPLIAASRLTWSHRTKPTLPVAAGEEMQEPTAARATRRVAR